MVIIHVIEETSHVEFEALPTGFWENFIQFGAGPLAAPVFIFSMGLGIVYSRSQEPKQLFKRGVRLWLAALALNICRDVIPRLIVCLISGSAPEWEVLRYQIFNIDILHFAGLAFMLTALLKKLKVPVLALVPIGIIMQIIGWMTSFKDYLHLDPGIEMSVVIGILIALASMGITKILPRIKW